MRIQEWSISDPDETSPIFTPVGIRDDWSICQAPYTPAGWSLELICTRAKGHGGRHHAAIITGEVLAVWGDPR